MLVIMPISYQWYAVAVPVVRLTLHHAWTWDEFADTLAALYTEIDERSQPVGVIVYIQPYLHLPPRSVSNARRFIRKRHPLIAITVFCEPPSLLMRIWRTIGKVYRLDDAQRPFLFMEDEQAALAVIKTHLQSSGAGTGDLSPP